MTPRSYWLTFTAAALTGLWSAPVSAQMVTDCESYVTSAQMVAEPWETNTATYAKGAIRVAVMDTVEPAAGAFHLMILAPSDDELGFRACHLVSETSGIGFGGMTLQGAKAAYDPAKGLTLRLPTSFWLPDTDSYVDGILAVTINQATGVVSAAREVP
jgi:hypothetical protein